MRVCRLKMHVLVTHHLYGGNEMEGRAPDAERAIRRCDDCATIPALLSSRLISVENETSSDDDHPLTLTLLSERERKGHFFPQIAPELFAECAYAFLSVRVHPDRSFPIVSKCLPEINNQLFRIFGEKGVDSVQYVLNF